MTIVASGSTQTFTANARGQTFMVAKNSGSLVSITGDAGTHSMSASPRRRSFGPLEIGQKIVVSAALGDVIVEACFNGSPVTGGAGFALVSAAGGSVGGVAVTSPNIQRLRRQADVAQKSNGYDNPIATDQPTLITGTSHDATLTYVTPNPALSTTAAQMNLMNGVWAKDGANARWRAVTDTVTAGNLAGCSRIEITTYSPKCEIITSGGPLYVEVNGLALSKDPNGIAVTGAGGGAPGGSKFLGMDFVGTTGAIKRTWVFVTTGFIYSIGLTAGYRMWAPHRDDIAPWYFEGDSWTANTVSDSTMTGSTATTYNNIPITPMQGIVGIACQRLGIRSHFNGAEGGTGYFANGTTKTTFAQRADSIIAAHQSVPGGLGGVVIMGSINDNNQSLATVYGIAVPYYQKLRAGLGREVPIIVVGVQSGASDPTAAMLIVESALQQAVTDIGDPMLVFIPQSSETPPWVDNNNKAAVIGPDLVHPLVTGVPQISERLQQGILYALSSMGGSPGIA